MLSRADLDDLLAALLVYLRDRGLVTPWLKSKIKLVRSKKAEVNNKASPRAFCFVIIGEYNIHFSEALLKLPIHFVVGILLHEVAHMVVREGRDPELDVDEWVLDYVPEAEYTYQNVTYGRRQAHNLERVSVEFCDLVLSTAEEE